MYKKIKMAKFNPMKFIYGIEAKYGKPEAVYVAGALLKLKDVAIKNNWLDELSSPRYVARLKLHPTKGYLIAETIDNNFKGYRYEATPYSVYRKKVKYATRR